MRSELRGLEVPRILLELWRRLTFPERGAGPDQVGLSPWTWARVARGLSGLGTGVRLSAQRPYPFLFPHSTKGPQVPEGHLRTFGPHVNYTVAPISPRPAL